MKTSWKMLIVLKPTGGRQPVVKSSWGSCCMWGQGTFLAVLHWKDALQLRNTLKSLCIRHFQFINSHQVYNKQSF